MEEPTYDTFSFDHWLFGYEMPNFPTWRLSKKESGGIQENPLYRQITEAKNFVFDTYLEIEVKFKIKVLEKILPTLDIDEKTLFLKAEIDTATSIHSKYPIQNLLTNTHEEKLISITGPIYQDLLEHRDFIERSKHRKKLNEFHYSLVNYHFKKYCEEILVELKSPKISEKLENLPHKLSLLYDLGVLDLLEERFNYKNYHGKAMQTDKAKLLASLFEIEDSEKVRQALKNSDFLSTKAKSKAVQTLINHGLQPEKLID
jgi:hypothetical protein